MINIDIAIWYTVGWGLLNLSAGMYLGVRFATKHLVTKFKELDDARST